MATKRYKRIVFMQGEEAVEPLRILDEQGKNEAADYLAQWDMGDPGEVMDKPSAGTSDYVHRFRDGYILTWNIRLGYIGLEKVVYDSGK